MKNLCLLLLVACSSLQAIAQLNLDSLYTVWEDESQPDSSRVAAYKEIIWNGYIFSRPDTAEVMAEALHAYAKQHSYPFASSLAYNMQGVANHVQGNYPRALKYYKNAVAIQEELGDKARISSLGNIGTIYKELGNYDLALEYYGRNLKIEGARKSKLGLGAPLSNTGLVYYLKGNYSLALENYQKALEVYEEYGYKRGIASSLVGIGIIYADLDDNLLALEYFQKSLAIQEEIGDKIGNAVSLSNTGNSYRKEGNNSLALDYCQRGLKLAEEIGVLEQQKVACQCLYDTYKVMNKGNEALVYLEKMRVIEDSLNAEETAKELQQMEFEKQMLADSIANAEEARLIEEAHQEELREKKRTRNIFGGVGFFALLLAGGFYWRWRYVRKSKAVLQVEKDRSENLLLNILPEEIAEELKEKGRADARDFEMVSILFTDFKGFTAASEKLSAQDLVTEINACFEAFDGIMGKYGIEKIKTIGDAYMAAGGLPVPTDDSVKNTVLAALEMQDFIQVRKAKLDSEGKPGFEMRVGVHTGPVVAGIVGVKKFQYDIWGDTVNTASRMESSGEVGKVNISEATYELLKDDPAFRFESRGKVEAKGKGEMEMYFVSQKG